MISNIDVCNMALQILGSRKITSFDDQTLESRLCKQQYPLSRIFLLRVHPWNFAIKRVNLAPLSDKPIFGWSHQFQQPGDFILLLEVMDMAVGGYVFEGNKILANTDTLNIRYVSDVTDVVLFDTEFINVLVYHLAVSLFDSLDGTISKKKEFQQSLDTLLNNAKMTDGRENPVMQIQESSWLAARR